MTPIQSLAYSLFLDAFQSSTSHEDLRLNFSLAKLSRLNWQKLSLIGPGSDGAAQLLTLAKEVS